MKSRNDCIEAVETTSRMKCINCGMEHIYSTPVVHRGLACHRCGMVNSRVITAEPAEERHNELVATEYELREHYQDMSMPYRLRFCRMLSPFYEGEKWAVRAIDCCLNKSGDFLREPLPSARDDAFYDRCRFDTLDEAVAAYKACEAQGRGLFVPARSAPDPVQDRRHDPKHGIHGPRGQRKV